MIESDINTEVKFLVSKTRVAPLQTQTIPRLELLSALLLSKLITSVMEALSSTISQLAVRCYTDSLVALFWICGTNKEWKPFVNTESVKFVTESILITGVTVLVLQILQTCLQEVSPRLNCP